MTQPRGKRHLLQFEELVQGAWVQVERRPVVPPGYTISPEELARRYADREAVEVRILSFRPTTPADRPLHSATPRPQARRRPTIPWLTLEWKARFSGSGDPPGCAGSPRDNAATRTGAGNGAGRSQPGRPGGGGDEKLEPRHRDRRGRQTFTRPAKNRGETRS